jgi:hypothetical protein
LGRYSIRKPETGQLLVVSSTKSKLEEINNVSRQLLSQLSDLEVLPPPSPEVLQKKSSTYQLKSSDEGNIANKILQKLMTERHQLIVSFFESYSSNEINLELVLVNEMIKINTELTSKSQVFKKSIKEQVLKIKNSNKVTRFYQKY